MSYPIENRHWHSLLGSDVYCCWKDAYWWWCSCIVRGRMIILKGVLTVQFDVNDVIVDCMMW